MEKREVKLGNLPLIFETGRMAKQAGGAVTVQYGETVVFVAATGSKQAREGMDYFPLTVDYRENSYAGGKIPGGYFKREGKATERETLTARLIDRPVRPLFPEGYFNEVQVIASVLCSDKEHNGDVLAINAASAALMLSGLPYMGPVAACRVGEIDGEFVINPTFQQLEESTLDIVIVTTEKGVIMIEAGAELVSEERIVESLEFATKALKPVLQLQKDLAKKCGRPKVEAVLTLVPDSLMEEVRKASTKELDRINREEKTKESRDEAITALQKKLVEQLVTEGGETTESQVKNALHDVEKEVVRKYILDEKKRTDGRKHDEIRKVTAEIGVLPRTHGSALFTRGQTQSLGVTTLGTSRDEQRLDSIEGDIFKSFMLHYNFPPYSVGEVKMMRGPGRREIGHGALAERSLRAVVPSTEEFPYTIRVVSDILESNGSSSMASVCSGCLSLMDAGVPIKAPVSGIAMGLVKEGSKVAILSDIAGVEDHLGDMDFKVAGTQDGVTAIQMDLKLKDSLDIDTLRKALEQAKKGRLFILDKMTAVLKGPREEMSAYAPRITNIKVNPDKIREIIGPGGKMIRKITADSGAEVEVQDDGTVVIASSDQTASEKAIQMINALTEEPELGKIYEGVVKRLMNFGVFCEIMPGKEGLVHISELADGFVDKVETVAKVGDVLKVKVVEIDKMGRVNLSVKQVATGTTNPPASSRNRRNGKGKTFNQKRPRR